MAHYRLAICPHKDEKEKGIVYRVHPGSLVIDVGVPNRLVFSNLADQPATIVHTFAAPVARKGSSRETSVSVPPNGEASLDVPALARGKYTYTVEVGGDRRRAVGHSDPEIIVLP